MSAETLAENPGASKHFGDRPGAIRLAAVEFAEVDVTGAQMNNFPRRDHLDSDARVPAHDGVAAEDRGELRLVLDAVLQRQNRAARLEAS